MWRLTRRLPTTGRNPVTGILLLVMMALGAVAVIAVGTVVLVILLLAAVMFFTVLYLRTQWLRHQLGLNVHPRNVHRNRDGVTLEGEYTVHHAESEKPDRKI